MEHFSFARRTDWPNQTNAYNLLLEDLKGRHVPLLDLTASNPTECGLSYPPEILSVLSSAENLRYDPQSCGLAQARRAVADDYRRQGARIAADNIVLTASTSEAYGFLLRLLVNPGENVLIPKPSYPLFQFLLEINDVHGRYYPLSYEGQWRLDRDAVETLVDAQTRAIIVVNPNNPTGSFLSAAELDFLNELCRKHALAIISDEVFFDYALTAADRVSCAGNQPVLTFTLGGLSKSLGLPQMKAAWIAASGPQAHVRESLARLEIIADTYLSVNTPVQNALPSWLKLAPDIRQQILSRVKDNARWLSSHVSGPTELLLLQGGWSATLRVPAVKSEEEWVMEFLNEDHVCVYPGYFFDFESGTCIVLSLLPPADAFREATGRILCRLAQYT